MKLSNEKKRLCLPLFLLITFEFYFCPGQLYITRRHFTQKKVYIGSGPKSIQNLILYILVYKLANFKNF